MEVEHDNNQTLRQLSESRGTSIVSQLLEIADQQNQLQHVKFLHFIRKLKCLQPQGMTLFTNRINALKGGGYVALSYTHQGSGGRMKASNQYWVQDRGRNNSSPVKVRDCIVERCIRYMEHNRIPYLWVDKHCMPQRDCPETDCNNHGQCIRRRDAMQVMDLVYQRSASSVAPLSWRIDKCCDLEILSEILEGDLVTSSGFVRSQWQAKRALQMLDSLGKDLWFKRAWTFQENYRAGRKMYLLILHDPKLEEQKQKRKKKGKHDIFGHIPGELCISAVDLSTEATRLCLALRRSRQNRGYSQEKQIKHVLWSFKRYAIWLDGRKPMTPTIVADVESRGLKKPWDRLAVIANCCRYPTRLDHMRLKKRKCSLSLSILAMCLLNGEILDNSRHADNSAEMTMSTWLKEYSYSRFQVPRNHRWPTTFIKGCRFTNVALTVEGISTKGHLWKLSGKKINSRSWNLNLEQPRSGNLSAGDYLSNNQRECLMQLALRLKEGGDNVLANRLDTYLKEDAQRKNHITASQRHLLTMAREVATAIEWGETLRLARLSNDHPSSPCRAIFISDRKWGSLVFTSFAEADLGSEHHDANDQDCHVNLGVVVDDMPGQSQREPRLRVDEWAHGLCFYNRIHRTNVIFPWPTSLLAV